MRAGKEAAGPMRSRSLKALGHRMVASDPGARPGLTGTLSLEPARILVCRIDVFQWDHLERPIG